MPGGLLALGLAFAQPWLVPAGTGGLGVVAPAHAQPAALAEAHALVAYEKALNDFKAILATRRAQVDAKKKLPNLPGPALYRLKVMSTYKELTDALPERIGRPNYIAADGAIRHRSSMRIVSPRPLLWNARRARS